MPPYHDRRVERVLSFVMDDLTRSLTLAQAAQIAGLEPTYFSKRCKRAIGITFTEWVTHARIRAAKRLLEQVDMPVMAVAINVGYGDLTTFERAFRRMEGLSPREFRRERTRAGTMLEGMRATRNAETMPAFAEIRPRNAETRKR